MYVKLASRVGDGPFPTELFDEVGNRIRESRSRFLTLAVPRRVGWFDSVDASQPPCIWVTNLSLNSIDILSGY